MAGKKQKVVHVDNLIIHAQNVEIVTNGQDNKPEENMVRRERDPWDFFWGWQPREIAPNREGLENNETGSDRLES